jgi:hypothetical protein
MFTGVLALLQAIAGALISALRPRASLVAKSLAVGQQLAVLRMGRRPRLRPIDPALSATERTRVLTILPAARTMPARSTSAEARSPRANRVTSLASWRINCAPSRTARTIVRVSSSRAVAARDSRLMSKYVADR